LGARSLDRASAHRLAFPLSLARFCMLLHCKPSSTLPRNSLNLILHEINTLTCLFIFARCASNLLIFFVHFVRLIKYRVANDIQFLDIMLLDFTAFFKYYIDKTTFIVEIQMPIEQYINVVIVMDFQMA
jgi:hypothetical protein